VPNRIVQQHVYGEWTPQKEVMHPNQPPPERTFVPPNYQPPEESAPAPEDSAPAPEDSAPASTGSPFLDQPDRVERIESEDNEPTPTVQQRRFSAPQSEWDPIREAPPADSRPEAANFPQQVYTMSDDKRLFQPPKSYPAPPKDLWYEVPKTAPEKPKTIFPWEATQAKPTRVFPDDPPSPVPEKPTPAPIDTTSEPIPGESPTTPTIQITPVEPFASYSRVNAWDEHPSIQQYMNRFQFGRRANVQVLYNSSDVTSPPAGEGAAGDGTAKKRPSLKLTDFPTEFERPSLPVTPAPVRRDIFWAEERDAEGELPAAEGVPAPADWDPLRKLEELQRRQSQVLAEGPRRPSVDAPQRELPGGAVLLPSSEEDVVPMTSVTPAKEEAKEAKSVSASDGTERDGPTKEKGNKSVPAELEELDDGAMGENQGVFSPT
jgi:glycogenin